MPKWQDGDTVELITFRQKISLLANYRVKYPDHIIVKWCSGITCNWCVSLDDGLNLALLLHTLLLSLFPQAVRLRDVL